MHAGCKRHYGKGPKRGRSKSERWGWGGGRERGVAEREKRVDRDEVSWLTLCFKSDLRVCKVPTNQVDSNSKQRGLAYVCASVCRHGKCPLPERACEICKEKKRKVYAVGRFNHAMRQDWWEALNRPKVS